MKASGQDTANTVGEMMEGEEEEEEGCVWGEEFHCWRHQQPCSTLINSMI